MTTEVVAKCSKKKHLTKLLQLITTQSNLQAIIVCCYSQLGEILTPESGLQGYWDPYPIDMEFRPPCMVLSTIGISKQGKLEGQSTRECSTTSCLLSFVKKQDEITVQNVTRLCSNIKARSFHARPVETFCRAGKSSEIKSFVFSTLYFLSKILKLLLAGFE